MKKTANEFLEELKKEAEFYIKRHEYYEHYYVTCWNEILIKIKQFQAEQNKDDQS